MKKKPGEQHREGTFVMEVTLNSAGAYNGALNQWLGGDWTCIEHIFLGFTEEDARREGGEVIRRYIAAEQYEATYITQEEATGEPE